MEVISTVSTHDIRIDIKRNLSLDDFCEKYACSPSEFKSRIQTIFKHRSDDIMRQINSNRKKSPRQPRTPAKPQLPPTPPVIELEEVASTPVSSDKVLPPPKTDLATLRQLETEESEKVIRIETDHKSLASEHRECIKTLRAIQSDLQSLRSVFKAKTAEYEATINQANALAAEMNELSALRREHADALSELRAQIRLQSTVTFCVYDDGEIATVTPTDFVANSDGEEPLYRQLLENSISQNLRVRDVRTLAKIICIAKNASVPIEYVFDNDDLQKAYEEAISI